MQQTLQRKHLKGLYTDEEFVKLNDELSAEYYAKKSLLSEKQIEQIDIETILEWNHYYLTHLDEILLKADIKTKHLMESSILPEKTTREELTNRTLRLGLGYRLNELFEEQNGIK